MPLVRTPNLRPPVALPELSPRRWLPVRFRFTAHWAALLLPLLVGTALRAQPAGVVHRSIACDEAPDQTYALYVPSGYTNDRAWPILYCFDPGAQGHQPVERLYAAAERFGYIVAASNNSKNGSWEYSATSAAAMIRDTQRRFNLDGRRVYGGGLSGGARTACALAGQWRFAGVLAAGAGFPESKVPDRVPFAFFGTVGRTDMNYCELKHVDTALAQMRVPHRIAVFEGGHEWFPTALAPEALGWFELQAMRAGRRPRDAMLIATLFSERMAAAAAMKQEAERYFENAAIVADFSGLTDVAQPTDTVARLQNSDSVKKYLKAEKKAEQQEERWLKRLAEAAATPPREPRPSPFIGDGQSRREDPFPPREQDRPNSFGQSREPETERWPRPDTDRVVARGPIDPYETLREVAADVQHEARTNAAARRALNGFSGMLIQQSVELSEAGEDTKAICALEMSIVASPEDGRPHFWLARACAKAGQKEKGRAALKEARAHGFADEQRLAELDAKLAH